mmetsp:Transcript_10186/g.17741  ORF Transcript_10186/g.17741 Transcript_10186/m.17741 type:complete len:118 (-) Transcript_10186:442-795(-)
MSDPFTPLLATSALANCICAWGARALRERSTKDRRGYARGGGGGGDSGVSLSLWSAARRLTIQLYMLQVHYRLILLVVLELQRPLDCQQRGDLMVHAPPLCVWRCLLQRTDRRGHPL